MSEMNKLPPPQEVLSRIGLESEEQKIQAEVIAAAKQLGVKLADLYRENQGKIQMVIAGASRKVAVDLFKTVISWAEEKDREILQQMLDSAVRLNPKENSEMYSSGWQERGGTMTDVIGGDDELLLFWEDHISQGEKAERLLYRGSEENRKVVVAGFVGKNDDYHRDEIITGTSDSNLYRLLESISMFRSAEFRERAGLTQHRSAKKAPWAKAVFKGLKSGQISESLGSSWSRKKD